MTTAAPVSGSTRNQPIRWPEPSALAAGLLFLGLLILRLLATRYSYFWEEDEAALATGVAALVKDNIGSGLYRYGPQLGYYRLIELLCRLFGGDVYLIPHIMKTVSAVSGAVIPVTGLFLFRHHLRPSLRWLTAGMLAINPIVWESARYGNTAILQTALVAISITVLSNRPRPMREWAALALLAAGTMVRADAVLVWPVAALLIWMNHPNDRAVGVGRFVLCGLMTATLYLVLAVTDPRMDDIFGEVMAHVANAGILTRFWEFLLWAMSPIPLVFAVLGIRRLLDTHRRIALTIVVWCGFLIAFYFGSTTTPRYFLLIVIPFSVASAAGIYDLVSLFSGRFAPGAALVIAFAASLHLFVGLGHFAPDRLVNPFVGPTISTHDGKMMTGAFLYGSYNPGGQLLGHIRSPENFGVGHASHEGLLALIRDMEHEARNDRTAIVLLGDTRFGQVFHFYTQAFDGEYISRAPGMSLTTETWLRLFGMNVMTISLWNQGYLSLERLPVAEGDLFYVLGPNPFPDDVAARALDHRLMVNGPKNIAPNFVRRFDVVARPSES